MGELSPQLVFFGPFVAELLNKNAMVFAASAGSSREGLGGIFVKNASAKTAAISALISLAFIVPVSLAINWYYGLSMYWLPPNDGGAAGHELSGRNDRGQDRDERVRLRQRGCARRHQRVLPAVRSADRLGGGLVPGHAALVTAGGKGSRISELGVEKPLVLIAGVPMIDRLLDELARSSMIDRMYVSVSPLAPMTREHLKGMDVIVIDTPGNGYVADLNGSMNAIEEDAVLVCPSDMPLITSAGVDELIATYDERAQPSLTVALPPTGHRVIGIDRHLYRGDRRQAADVLRSERRRPSGDADR